MEKTVSIVKAYYAARGTLVVVIPKEVRDELGIENGKKFFVKVNKTGDTYKIIYEPVV